MTAITSYTTLLTALATWNKRSDLTTLYPQFVALAEAHFNRELFHPEGEVTSTQAVSDELVALPTDFISAKEVYLVTDPVTTLTAMSISALRDTYTWEGQPVAYAVSAGNMVLGPSPDSEYTLSLTYVASLDALSDSNETNWLITAHPDLYLAAVKFYANKYLRDEQAAADDLAMASMIIDSINRAGNRARLPAGPLRMQPTVRE